MAFDINTIIKHFELPQINTHGNIPYPILYERSELIRIFKAQVGENLYSDLLKLSNRTDLTMRMAIKQPLKDHYDDVKKSGNEMINLIEWAGHYANITYQSAQGRLFEVDPFLDHYLSLTDIGDKTPAKFFHMPFPSIYFHFGSNADDYYLHTAVGSYPLKGAYINKLKIFTDPFGDIYNDFHLDFQKGVDVFEIVLMAGENNSHPLEYGYIFQRLVMPRGWEDMSLMDVLEMNFNISHKDKPEHTTITNTTDFKNDMRYSILHIIKVLLYISSVGADVFTFNEYDDLSQQGNNLKSPRKIEKFQRKLKRAYNRIILGKRKSQEVAKQSSADKGHGVKPHWRRGHYRMQPFGPGRKEHKLILIDPTFIGSLANGAKSPPPKTYKAQL